MRPRTPQTRSRGTRGALWRCVATFSLFLIQIAQIGLNAALQLEVIFHARRHDDPQSPALALEQAVEHRRAEVDAVAMCGKRSLGRAFHWRSASSTDLAKPRNSSSGVVWALPTTKRPELVDEERVGHGAAGIHGQDILAGLHESSLSTPRIARRWRFVDRENSERAETGACQNSRLVACSRRVGRDCRNKQGRIERTRLIFGKFALSLRAAMARGVSRDATGPASP